MVKIGQTVFVISNLHSDQQAAFRTEIYINLEVSKLGVLAPALKECGLSLV